MYLDQRYYEPKGAFGRELFSDVYTYDSDIRLKWLEIHQDKFRTCRRKILACICIFRCMRRICLFQNPSRSIHNPNNQNWYRPKIQADNPYNLDQELLAGIHKDPRIFDKCDEDGDIYLRILGNNFEFKS